LTIQANVRSTTPSDGCGRERSTFRSRWARTAFRRGTCGAGPVAGAGGRAVERHRVPEKSLGVLCGAATKVSRFELIAAECAAHDVTRMAELLGVSTSGYYKHLHTRTASEPSPRVQRRRDLEVKILAHHRVSNGTYGSPRITADLHAAGERVSANTVAGIMAELGIEGISPRTFKTTTTVDPAASFPPDLVGRCFDQGCIDVVWSSDITYLSCGEGDMFLCAIRDEHSRRALGWAVDDHMRTELVTTAVDRAVFTRGGRCRGTILHSPSTPPTIWRRHVPATGCVAPWVPPESAS